MPELDAPAVHATLIFLSDIDDLPVPCRAIHLGVAGDLTVTMIAGETVTFANMYIGWHPIRAKRVWVTGTTADLITVVW